MNDITKHLGEDYLRAARNFIFLAEQACIQIPANTAERVMIAEDPLTFLISHAAELYLKAVLAFKGYDEKKLTHQPFGHDLRALYQACQKEGVVLNDRFIYWVECVADNHYKHDNRYPRSFAGFPNAEHERLSALIRTRGDKNELRKYGLVSKSNVNAEDFIRTINVEINALVAVIDAPKVELTA